MKKNNTCNWFEGFYFKHQCDHCSIAFIPSIHITETKSYAVIQVISSSFTRQYRFELCDASIIDTTVMIGHNVFSKEGISIELENEEGSIRGRLFYNEMVNPDYDIMGFFKYLPKMECSHGVISVYHKLQGTLMIDNQEVNFNNGWGYIEKDSGISFPRKYLWTQCLLKKFSVMISIAEIPYLRMHFNGCIALILYKGKQYRIATYKGAKIIVFQKDKLTIKQGKYTLKARLIKAADQTLKAPVAGDMQREIEESISTSVYYEFSIHEQIVFSFVSNRASFEYSEII